MDKLNEGSGNTSILINRLTLVVNGQCDGQVTNTEPFFVDVKYYHEAEIKATEDEEGCAEYVEIFCARTTSRVTFHDGKALTLNVERGACIISLLNEGQYEWLVTELIKQSKGSVRDASLDKYYDGDKGRPAVSRRVQQELGFGLNSVYDWSDK